MAEDPGNDKRFVMADPSSVGSFLQSTSAVLVSSQGVLPSEDGYALGIVLEGERYPAFGKIEKGPSETISYAYVLSTDAATQLSERLREVVEEVYRKVREDVRVTPVVPGRQ